MKNTIVRASILALALLGFGASAVLSSNASSKHTVTVAGGNGASALCAPGDPNGCGID